MKYKKLFVYAPTEALLKVALENEVADLDAIGFVEEPREIWALGNFYPCPYSKEELDNLFQESEEKFNLIIEELKGNVSENYNTLEKIEDRLEETKQDLTDEISRALQAESNLQEAIEAEESRATAAEQEITNNLNLEIQDRQNADTALENKINGISIVEVAAIDANTLKSYELHDSEDLKKGVTINIPKDLTIKDVKLSTTDATLAEDGTIQDGTSGTALCISYILADGSYKLVALDYSKFIEETEFGDGLEVNNHVVSIKIDPNTESYLTLTENGLGITGINEKFNEEDLKIEDITPFVFDLIAGDQIYEGDAPEGDFLSNNIDSLLALKYGSYSALDTDKSTESPNWIQYSITSDYIPKFYSLDFYNKLGRAILDKKPIRFITKLFSRNPSYAGIRATTELKINNPTQFKLITDGNITTTYGTAYIFENNGLYIQCVVPPLMDYSNPSVTYYISNSIFTLYWKEGTYTYQLLTDTFEVTDYPVFRNMSYNVSLDQACLTPLMSLHLWNLIEQDEDGSKYLSNDGTYKTIDLSGCATKEDLNNYLPLTGGTMTGNIEFTSGPDANGYEYVDLGLPSGNLWAKCNVGASTEEEAGLYFQWGDTQGYTAEQVGNEEGQKAFTWNDYKFSIDGSSSNFSKYNATDNKTVLDLEDDAAHVNMGGDWRMPTFDEFKELCLNTDIYLVPTEGEEIHCNAYEYNEQISITWDGDIELLKGIKFYKKKDNQTYIFVPASGDALNGSVSDVGGSSSLWSSSISSDDQAGIFFGFIGDYMGYTKSGRREYGFLVRGILPESTIGVIIPGKSDTDLLNAAGSTTSISDITTQIQAAIVDSAPETLDTLNELAAALGDDPNFATTITNQLGNKLDSSIYYSLPASIVSAESAQITHNADSVSWIQEFYSRDGDGNYSEAVSSPTTKTINAATATTAGVMTPEDFKKLSSFILGSNHDKISKIVFDTVGNSDSAVIYCESVETESGSTTYDNTSLIFEVKDNANNSDGSEPSKDNIKFNLLRLNSSDSGLSAETIVEIGTELLSKNPTSKQLERVVNVSELSNYVTLDGGQTISGRKTFSNILGLGNNSYLFIQHNTPIGEDNVISVGDDLTARTHLALDIYEADNDNFGIYTGGPTDSGFTVLATGDNGVEPLYVAQYGGQQNAGESKLIHNLITLMDNDGNQKFNKVTAESYATTDGTANDILIANGTTNTLKTVNGESLLGNGNVSIEASDVPITDTLGYFDSSNVEDALKEIKQPLDTHLLNSTPGLKHIPSGGAANQVLAWDSNGTARWDYVSNLGTSTEDMLAYGVEWDVTVSDPVLTRIGNPSLHKSLPILSGIYGCICLGNVIRYRLADDDWRFRREPIYTQVNLVSEGGTITITGEPFNTLQYDKLWVKINDIKIQIASIETSTSTATLVNNEYTGTLHTGTMLCELGSVRNGYDGTVRLYVPTFYIKSVSEGNIRRVWTSTSQLDSLYYEQTACLIDAYRCTVLNTVPLNMGYLSTLPVNSLVSIVNTNSYCRGGNNNSSYDLYLESDPRRTLLGKPRTNMARGTMRTYAANTNSHLLSYTEYKNIFYWLYVIEYANFNCLATFSSSLDENGYHTGGLGNGVTTMNLNVWSGYNANFPLTPCGYLDSLGNGSGIEPLVLEAFYITVNPTKNFGSWTSQTLRVGNNNITKATMSKGNPTVTITNVAYSGQILYCNSLVVSGLATYTISGLLSGQSISFSCSGLTTLTVSSDGLITMNWGIDGAQTRNINANFTGSCNITITCDSVEASVVAEYPSQSITVNRWRGWDNPFGDIFTNLDGVIVDADTESHSNGMDYVYVCNDPSKFADTLTEDYTKVADSTHTEGYVKAFDLKDNALIIASEVGAGSTTYMCDYHWTGNSDKTLRTVIVGGCAHNGSDAGLGSLDSGNSVTHAWHYRGFRSVSVFS